MFIRPKFTEQTLRKNAFCSLSFTDIFKFWLLAADSSLLQRKIKYAKILFRNQLE